MPITRAPATFANCTARWPTPPAAPAISAVCPASSPPRSKSACQAVIPVTGSAAAARNVGEHGVALGEGVDARGLDRAGHVAPGGDRQLRLHVPALVLPVDRVDRRGVHADQHLGGAGLGRVDVLDAEHLGAACLVNPYRLHPRSSIGGAEFSLRFVRSTRLPTATARPKSGRPRARPRPPGPRRARAGSRRSRTRPPRAPSRSR